MLPGVLLLMPSLESEPSGQRSRPRVLRLMPSFAMCLATAGGLAACHRASDEGTRVVIRGANVRGDAPPGQADRFHDAAVHTARALATAASPPPTCGYFGYDGDLPCCPGSSVSPVCRIARYGRGRRLAGQPHLLLHVRQRNLSGPGESQRLPRRLHADGLEAEDRLRSNARPKHAPSILVNHDGNGDTRRWRRSSCALGTREIAPSAARFPSGEADLRPRRSLVAIAAPWRMAELLHRLSKDDPRGCANVEGNSTPNLNAECQWFFRRVAEVRDPTPAGCLKEFVRSEDAEGLHQCMGHRLRRDV